MKFGALHTTTLGWNRRKESAEETWNQRRFSGAAAPVCLRKITPRRLALVAKKDKNINQVENERVCVNWCTCTCYRNDVRAQQVENRAERGEGSAEAGEVSERIVVVMQLVRLLTLQNKSLRQNTSLKLFTNYCSINFIEVDRRKSSKHS